jgi:hypothetical protein
LLVGNTKAWIDLLTDGTKELSFSDHTHSEYASSSDLSSLKTSVSNGKASIASAITGKGVSTSSTAAFSTMATNIKKITTTPTYYTGTTSSLTVYEGGTFTVELPSSKPYIFVMRASGSSNTFGMIIQTLAIVIIFSESTIYQIACNQARTVSVWTGKYSMSNSTLSITTDSYNRAIGTYNYDVLY